MARLTFQEYTILEQVCDLLSNLAFDSNIDDELLEDYFEYSTIRKNFIEFMDSAEVSNS
jgi:hypothetical protein